MYMDDTKNATYHLYVLISAVAIFRNMARYLSDNGVIETVMKCQDKLSLSSNIESGGNNIDDDD